MGEFHERAIEDVAKATGFTQRAVKHMYNIDASSSVGVSLMTKCAVDQREEYLERANSLVNVADNLVDIQKMLNKFLDGFLAELTRLGMK